MATGKLTSIYIRHGDYARWKALPQTGAAEVFRRGLDVIEAELAQQEGSAPPADPLAPLMERIRADLTEALDDEGRIVWPERMTPPPRKPDARKIPRKPQGGMLLPDRTA